MSVILETKQLCKFYGAGENQVFVSPFFTDIHCHLAVQIQTGHLCLIRFQHQKKSFVHRWITSKYTIMRYFQNNVDVTTHYGI